MRAQGRASLGQQSVSGQGDRARAAKERRQGRGRSFTIWAVEGEDRGKSFSTIGLAGCEGGGFEV